MKFPIDGLICDAREDVSVLAAGAVIAVKLQIPLFWLRVPKGHGTNKSIEGDLEVLKKCKRLFVLNPISLAELKVEGS